MALRGWCVTHTQTGIESSVERLMKSIAGFMSEISDEFKIEVVCVWGEEEGGFTRNFTLIVAIMHMSWLTYTDARECALVCVCVMCSSRSTYVCV